MTIRHDPVLCGRVITHAVGDVTGDMIEDRVYLTGRKHAYRPYWEDIELVVQDGRSGIVTKTRLPGNCGYNPSLFLGDFTGNSAKDIFININGDANQTYTYDYVFSYIRSQADLLFSYETYNNGYAYNVSYADHYKVRVISGYNKKIYDIDLTHKDEKYLSEIYTPDGKLKEQIIGNVLLLNAAYPIDMASTGKYQLLCRQRITGRHCSDTLGYIENYLKSSGTELYLFDQNIAVG